MRANPLFWLHVRLAGNWRNTALVALVYGALIIASAVTSYRVNAPREHGAISAFWLGLVTATQALFLFVIGPGTIRRAVLRDFQNGMLESHRLSPMSNLRIVTGYLIGPTVNLLALYGVSLLLGTYFAAKVAMMVPGAVEAWLAGQITIVSLAVFIATTVLLGALASRGKFNIAGLIVVAFLVSSVGVVVFVPGLALVGGVMTLDLFLSFFSGKTAVATGPFSALLAIIAQIAFSVVFAVAACRKIRAPERPLFSIPMSLVLAAISAVVLVGGVALSSSMPGPFAANDPDLLPFKVFGSTVAFIVVTQFTLIAAAVECFYVDRAAALGVPIAAAKRRLMSLLPAVLGVATTALMSTMYQVVLRSSDVGVDLRGLEATFSNPARGACVVAAILLCFWTDYNWIYAAAARGKSILRAVVISAALLKLAPLIMDLLLTFVRTAREPFADARFDAYFSGLSPIGTLLLATRGHGALWPGLIVQAAVAALATSIGLRARRGLAPEVRPPPATVAPAGR